MTPYEQLLSLWVSFVALSILDCASTWLCLYALPIELRGKEMNPLFSKAHKKFWSVIGLKGFLILLGFWVFTYFTNQNLGEGLTAFRAIDLVIAFAVLNNLYIFLSRLILKRMTPTLIMTMDSLFERLVNKKVADVLSFYIVEGLICILAVSVALWI